jgi:site-specific DNA-methyltransferase (adenine-specific)
MIRILIGDMRERLAELPDNSVDSCVCDPPYHLTSIVKRFGPENAAPAQVGKTGAYARASKGFMGRTWDGGDVAFQPETWAEVLRVLKPGGHLVAFSGTRTYHRMAVAIEDAGFEVRDMITDLIASDTHVARFLASLTDEQRCAFARCIDESTFGGMLAWCYGSGFPKSHDISKAIDKAAGAEREVVGPGRWNHVKGDNDKQADCLIRPGGKHDETAPATDAAGEWEGWGTALKPATEPICLARKPLSEKSIAANVLKWGTGALNIDGCRIEATPDDVAARESRNGTTDKGQVAVRVYGDFSGDGPRTNIQQGRWPANLCHDGSDEVVAGFPETESNSGEPFRRNTDKFRNTFGAFSGADSERGFYGDSGSAARFFYCAKATTEERGVGNNHPTVKPVSLMRWLVRLVTPKGGTVLDPFMGSGSTALACDAEQFDFIGCELSADYAAIAERRIKDAAGMFADVRIAA